MRISICVGMLGYSTKGSVRGHEGNWARRERTQQLLGEPMLNRAFWITWYDLPIGGRDAYLSWLHGTYMPKVKARPSVLWAAHYASENNVVPLGGGKGMVGHHFADDSAPVVRKEGDGAGLRVLGTR